MAALLKEAIKPNLVQTLEGNPVLIHGGPFANIAQGTNSIIATKMGMSHTDYVVTEAGFGADLGAEKFFNIKCRHAGISPKAVVIVATVRALKYHGNNPLSELKTPDPAAVERGLGNLHKHIETIKSFGLPLVVCVNRFDEDTDEEIAIIDNACSIVNIPMAVSEGYARGGEGTMDLARAVVKATESYKGPFKPTYELDEPVRTKIGKVCSTVYGAKHVIFSNEAKRQLKRFEDLGFAGLPVCIAKTQKSLSDDEKLLGRPENFDINIREFEIAAGAGFLIPIAGNILRMPGLPAIPAAEHIDIDNEGMISGLS
jgi:formate--tetrahydrofolate ligase